MKNNYESKMQIVTFASYQEDRTGSWLKCFQEQMKWFKHIDLLGLGTSIWHLLYYYVTVTTFYSLYLSFF